MICDNEHGVVGYEYDDDDNGYDVMTMNTWIVIMNMKG